MKNSIELKIYQKMLKIFQRIQAKSKLNNQETFIPNHLGTPTDLKPLLKDFQLAQINIVQQAFKEQYAK